MVLYILIELEMEASKECNVVGEGRSNNWFNNILTERLKPYLFCIVISFFQGGSSIVSKICLDHGMSRYVLAVYAGAFGTVTTAALALIFERKNESKLCAEVCLYIFLLGLIGVLGRISFYTGLQYTSTVFAAAMSNLTPSMTFLLAVFCRMEKLDIAKISGQAKIGGTIVALGGATLMTLYKGITVLQLDDHHTNQQTVSEVHLDNKKLMKGAPFLLIQTLIAAGCYILQTKIVKKYPAPFTFSTLTSLAATIFSTILAAIVDHKASSWKLSWNISLVAPLYSGTIMSGIVSYIQTLVIQRKGPVFVTAFKPFTTVTVALMGPFILKEALHLGGILGAVLIILGLYAILWGKEDEKKKSQVQSATSDQVLDIREEK